MSSKALFLDRDGVINVDYAYVHQAEKFEFIEGIFDLCRVAKEKDYKIIVITNQAGIGRGYYSEDDFHELTHWMLSEFSRQEVEIDDVYFCPFHPEKGIGEYRKDDPCRKPNPGMIFKAIREHGIDPDQSILVGDKESDVEAGINAGIRKNFMFKPNQGKQYISQTKATATFYSHQELLKCL